jgi:hypothetical protein
VGTSGWPMPSPPACTCPYLIVEQGGDAAIVGGQKWRWRPPGWPPPPPPAHSAPYLIIEQGGNAAIVGGRSGCGDLWVADALSSSLYLSLPHC